MKPNSLSVFGRLATASAIAFASILTVCPSHAGEVIVVATEETSSESALSQWWNGKYMTGNWFGLRNTLVDHGLTLTGKYDGVFYGVVDSEGGSRGFYDMQINFGGELDFAKALGLEALTGLKGFSTVRYRDSSSGSNPNNFVEANGMFNPSNYQSGTQWRLLTFGLEYSTPELFGIENFATLRGGWLQPQKEFIDQPLSKLFINNAVNSAKGVGGNIPFSSSFSTWGGTLNLKPTKEFYFKGGLFMAYPQATASSNHGLAQAGFGPDPSQNGLMAMAETGLTPKLGASELPGKYAIGGYYWGQQGNSFRGADNYGQYGFYGQFDQMLYREPSPEEPAPMGKGADGKTVASSVKYDSKSGKNFKEPVVVAPKLSTQGLYAFNLVSWAPKYNNLFPFYFQSGLVYEGLIPTRDADKTMFSIAYGSYSFYNIENLQDNGVVNQPNYTLIMEGDYRIQLNGWAYVMPFIQYIVKPNGTGNVANATVLGVAFGSTF